MFKLMRGAIKVMRPEDLWLRGKREAKALWEATTKNVLKKINNFAPQPVLYDTDPRY